jgi:transcriptional regulator with XRE-family HTH domain
MDEFSTRLKRLRKDFDVTQAALAKEIGVEPSAVGKYENGTQAYPRVDVLVRIADYFKVSIDYLIRGIQTVPVQENTVNGGNVSNCPFIQTNHGGVIYNGDGKHRLSPEAVELIRIYETLDGRERLKLLNFAVELERSDV